jgi:alpha-L-fucosidase
MSLFLLGFAAAAAPAGAETDEPRMQWWRDARFGLFLTWGPVSLKGTEISYSRGVEVPIEDYDRLHRQFNPVRFDAEAWVQVARDAGMKYVVFVAKHHDGFCNFDSRLTDYRITGPHSPFRRDITAELADACHKAGLRLGIYYSQPDWHHPDYRTANHLKYLEHLHGDLQEFSTRNHARYIEYLHGQVRELCTNYGRVDIWWFDGLGGPAADWDSERLLGMIRSLQPGIVINNRAGLPADFDTPEQYIGNFQRSRPWETCMTIGRQWSWKPGDVLKPLGQCVQTLVRTAGGDGNLLLNVGPMPDGRIEPRQADRLREMGRWLERRGETIYGTRGGPFKYSRFANGVYTSTHRGNRIFLHVLEWPKDNEPLILPPINKTILHARTLEGRPADVRQDPAQICVSVPIAERDEIDTIVIMELEGAAGDVPPVSGKWPSLAAGRPARASSVLQTSDARPEGVAGVDPCRHACDQADYGPEKAFDGDTDTRWAADTGAREAWLEVDLGTPQRIDQTRIAEACGERVQEFELQREVDGHWESFFKGTRIGEDTCCRFEAVTARRIRLAISRTSAAPSIREIQVLAAQH